MIKYDLNNRVAVVTGGAQGFGLAVTERFIDAGAKVVIWDIDEEAIKNALDKVKSENLSYQIVDVSNFENINKSLTLIEKIKKFIVINEEFAIENGMLTPTLKLKRKEIIKNYKQKLEKLY